LGGLGFGAYAAANRFLDSLAVRQNLRAWQNGDPARYRVINWDGWQTSSEPGATDMTLAEGMRVLDLLAAAPDLQHLMVSTTDLLARKRRWQAAPSQAARSVTEQSDARQKRVESTKPFRQAETDLEKVISQIWQTLFGFEDIGLDDNFFDLGGDSLIGTRYYSHLRAKVGVQLPLASLFEAPTLAGQAALASLKIASETRSTEALDLIEELI
jgi:phthiocerol/phenolphthiocerol synthesis type-I polyketide synthase E